MSLGLVVGFDDGAAALRGFLATGQGPTCRDAVHQDPGPLHAPLVAVELRLGAWLDHDMATHGATRTDRVGGGGEVERSALLARHATPPAATVEAQAHLAHGLETHLQPPATEAVGSPPLGTLACGRTGRTTADAIDQHIEVVHGLVVALGELDDPFFGGRLRRCRE